MFCGSAARKALSCGSFNPYPLKRLLATLFALLCCQVLFAQTDTLQNLIKPDSLPAVAQRLDSIQSNFQGRADSVQQAYTETTGKLQSLRDQYQHKADSLTALKLPADHYTGKVDSLNRTLADTQQKATAKLSALKQEATGKVNALTLTPDLQARAAQLTGSIDGVNLPGVSAPGMPALPGGLNATLPTLPGAENMGGLGNVPGLEGVKDVTKNLEGVSAVTQQAESLQQSAGQITEAAGNVQQVDKLAESQAGKLTEVKALQEQAGNLPANPLGGEEQAKEQLMSQARKVAVDHFAGKQEQLKQAMDQMAKYKQKYGSVQSIKDLPKRPPNAMKGRPFRERLVPGITLQVQHEDATWQADFYASAGYRISGRITAGLGWNQRWGYNFDNGKFRPGTRIFGPRAYGEFKLKKGFVLRGETEYMNAFVPPQYTATQDNGRREWVWGLFSGLKKEYNFIGNVRGNVQLLYNLYDPHNKSPYGDRLIARMGFEYTIKKRKPKK